MMKKHTIHTKAQSTQLPVFLLILVKVEMAAGNQNLIDEFHILPRFDDLALLNISYRLWFLKKTFCLDFWPASREKLL